MKAAKTKDERLDKERNKQQVFSFINKKTKELEQIRNSIMMQRREQAKMIVAPKPFDKGMKTLQHTLTFNRKACDV